MSATVTVYDLPDELHLNILDLLAGDIKALYACSLTCKLWSEPAQRSLFRTVHIDVRNSAAFAAAVSKRSQLADNIRELTLEGVERIPKPPRKFRPAEVRLLRLVAMDTSNPWVKAVLQESKHVVEQLSVRGCFTYDGAAFLAFLAEMPRLRNVDVDRSRFGSDDVPLVSAADASDLRSLSLVGSEYCDSVFHNAVTRTLLAFPQVYQNLSIIRIRLGYDNLQAFNDFLQVVGEGLRELDFGLGPDFFEWDSFPLTLWNCPKLRILTLETKLTRPSPGVDHLRWVPVLLATAPAELRRVKLVVRALRAERGDLAAFDLPDVARVLADARFTQVRQVLVLVLDGHLLREEIVQDVKARMVELDQRGVLKVARKERGVVGRRWDSA